MTLENAKVLYKHFKLIGREAEAAQLVGRFPELKEDDAPVLETPSESAEEPKDEVDEDGEV